MCTLSVPQTLIKLLLLPVAPQRWTRARLLAILAQAIFGSSCQLFQFLSVANSQRGRRNRSVCVIIYSQMDTLESATKLESEVFGFQSVKTGANAKERSIVVRSLVKFRRVVLAVLCIMSISLAFGVFFMHRAASTSAKLTLASDYQTSIRISPPITAAAENYGGGRKLRQQPKLTAQTAY